MIIAVFRSPFIFLKEQIDIGKCHRERGRFFRAEKIRSDLDIPKQVFRNQ